jgi:hypothetical protein
MLIELFCPDVSKSILDIIFERNRCVLRCKLVSYPVDGCSRTIHLAYENWDSGKDSEYTRKLTIARNGRGLRLFFPIAPFGGHTPKCHRSNGMKGTR